MILDIVSEALKERLLVELFLQNDIFVFICEVLAEKPPKVTEKIFIDNIVS